VKCKRKVEYRNTTRSEMRICRKIFFIPRGWLCTRSGSTIIIGETSLLCIKFSCESEKGNGERKSEREKNYIKRIKFDCMSIIRGTYYYRGKRPYDYEVNIYDVDDLKTLDFNLHVTNPEGKSTVVSWNFRHRGIDECIREYIELMASKKKV
jgi:hypothetical protein